MPNAATTPLQRTLVLYPYLLRQTWVFDDVRTGLKEEAFVCGITEMITRLVKARGIPAAEQGFQLTFAAESFDGADAMLSWVRADEVSGNWYQGEVLGQHMTGWLCPALQLYFEGAPPEIFVKADPLPAGVNPLWNPPVGGAVRRFVEAPA